MDEEVQLDCIGNLDASDSAEQPPLLLEPPGICDSYRETELLPRIGDLYQVPIPPLVTKSLYILQTELPTDDDVDHHTAASQGCFSVGLPISIMWIKEQGETVKNELDEFLNDLAADSVKSDSFEVRTFAEIAVKDKVEPMDDVPIDHKRPDEVVKCGSRSYHLVPGDYDEEWSDVDEAGFMLGLYIFGKNLVQVQSFVQSKTMGQILSFYYGKFYRSDRYRRWSECGKLKGRKRMFGQRIFTGSRQQELLSRLIPRVSEECLITLQKATKSFGDGKMMLEEFVFALKAAVGLNALVEAVGIGKGKQDLTSTAMDSLRSNHVTSVRPEVPVGKDCSKLTPLEIVNILTGGYRLSKTRSNDIFWEAVWPRLLARGWRSEQPKDGFRNSLVFIVPGIKRFSRRKLVKGDHYFDSITDVLSKVASNPSLLELDVGGENKSKEENVFVNGTKFDQEDSNGKERHCYLKPRRRSSVHDRNGGMSFTIVDTSLASGEKNKITQLRRLPTEVMNIYSSRSDSGSSSDTDTDSDSSSDQSMDEAYSSGNSSADGDEEARRKFSKEVSFHSHFHGNFTSFVNGFSNKAAATMSKDGRDKKTTTMKMQPRKSANPQAIRKRKPSNGNAVAPVAKRQQQKALPCDSSKTTFSTYGDLVGPRYLSNGIPSYVHHPQEKVPPSSSSSRGNSPNSSDVCLISTTSSGAEHSNNEHPQSREVLIDLNIPVLQSTEPEYPTMEAEERKKNLGVSKSSSLACCDDSNSQQQQQSEMNSRRHSTRNRPLTTKALEALACGFLNFTPNREPPQKPKQPSRRSKNKGRVIRSSDFGSESADFKGGDEPESCVTKGNSDIVNELQV
ncbi:hypothetical protein LINPERPRIM_LOCUS17618 [Linum perenne]